MDVEIRVPEFEDEESPTVVQWLVQEGEHVDAGDPLLELETDKAVFAVEAPADGIVSEELVLPGDTVEAGQRVGSIVAE